MGRISNSGVPTPCITIATSECSGAIVTITFGAVVFSIATWVVRAPGRAKSHRQNAKPRYRWKNEQRGMMPSLDNKAMPLVKARGLVKRYGGRPVLQGVDLEINSNEIVTLIGPNGSGKTTLLKLLLGIEKADAGHIEKRVGLRLGYVPQKLSFDQNLPMNVGYLLRLISQKKEALQRVTQELAIGHLAKSPLQSLSGGELQRVLLAQALLRDPQLLVLDEPVQGVDLMGQASLYELVRTVSRQRRCAVLMVSHDLHVVMAGTDRVLCLNQHICCSGTPQSVSADPAFSALFGDKIAGQVALYVHHHNHRHADDGHVVAESGPA